MCKDVLQITLEFLQALGEEWPSLRACQALKPSRFWAGNQWVWYYYPLLFGGCGEGGVAEGLQDFRP